jgi:putative molybdopterin biosynthesis protein
VMAELAVKVNSEIGRTEYLLVSLVEQVPATTRGQDPSSGQISSGRRETSLVAWPMGKGSGSVTTFSRADGFVTIDRHCEIVEACIPVNVTLLGSELALADLVVIGSHCLGLDLLLAEMHRRGWRTKLLAVGSTTGLDAARRGQCDVAGVHLFDPTTGQYNRPFLSADMKLVSGYGRMQGVAFRPGDARFVGRSGRASISAAAQDGGCVMVNRNAGSGTRILIDQMLEGAEPAGYQVQPKSHTAVAVAIAQGRADWGICIASAAQQAGLGFLPLQAEHYDFVLPKSRLHRPAVAEFVALLSDPQIVTALRNLNLLAAPA